MESWLMQSDISVWEDILDQFKPLVMKITRRINGRQSKNWIHESFMNFWVDKSPQDPRVIQSQVLYREVAVHPTGKNLLNNSTKVALLSLGFFRSKDGGAPVDELGRLPLWFHSHFQFESPSTTSTVVEGTSDWLWNSSCGFELHNV